MKKEVSDVKETEKKQPLVSVIIPVYNVEDYIEQCLKSVMNQTYKKIEIIVVNDGSTDNTMKILQRYEKIDVRMLLLNQENSGVSSARNLGIEAAKGKYTLFLDSDDYIETDTVKELVEVLEETGSDLARFNAVSFLDSQSSLDKDNVKQANYDFSHRLEHKRVYTEKVHVILRQTFSASVNLYMVRRELLVRNNIKFYTGIIHEDELFNTQVFCYAQSFVYLNRSFYHRRYRSNSIMTSSSSAKARFSFDSYVIVFKELNNFLQSRAWLAEQSKLIKRMMYSIFLSLKNNQKVDEKHKKTTLNLLSKYFDKKDLIYLLLLQVRRKVG